MEPIPKRGEGASHEAMLFQRLQARRAEGRHLGNLGLAYRDLGKVENAIQTYEQALAIAREIGSLFWTRIATGYLASALILAGWNLHGVKGTAVSRPIVAGIVIESDPDETFQAAARALVSALKDEELNVSGPEPIRPLGAVGMFSGQPMLDAKIRITIGPKF